MHLTIIATIHLASTQASFNLHLLGRLGLLEINEDGEVNAWEEIPVHKCIVFPLIISSKYIIFPFFWDQTFVRLNAQVFVRNGSKFKRVIGEHLWGHEKKEL